MQYRAPLKHLLKIGSEVLATTAQTLSGAVNELKTALSSLATVATTGSYSDLSDVPIFGTAAFKDIPASGNASDTQVVLGNDSRLTDARTPTSHTHPYVAKSGDTMTGVLKRTVTDGEAWINGCQGYSGLHLEKPEGARYYPVVSIKTAGGGGWAIGNYDNENLMFTYGTKANVQSGTNTVINIALPPTGGTLCLTGHTHNYAGSPSAGGDANNALKLNGYASDTAKTANTIVRRDGNGYIYAQYYNQASGSETATSSSYVMFCNSDGWLRKTPMSTIKSLVDTNTNTWRGYKFMDRSASFSNIGANSIGDVSFTGLNDQSGYTAIIAWHAWVETSSGGNSMSATTSTRMISGGKCTFALRNYNSSAKSGKQHIIVLYLQ